MKVAPPGAGKNLAPTIDGVPRHVAIIDRKRVV